MHAFETIAAKWEKLSDAFAAKFKAIFAKFGERIEAIIAKLMGKADDVPGGHGHTSDGPDVGGHHGHGPDGNVKLDEDGVVDTDGIDPDDAKRKRKGNRDDDYLLAVAEAKLLIEAQEALGTPAKIAATTVLGILKASYAWVSNLEARLDGPGNFDFYLYASPGEKVVNDYEVSRKGNGKYTEPTLPPKTIAKENGVEIVHYTKSGDHGPPHLHVKGGGPETKIGGNGNPIDGSPELTTTQRQVVDNNLKAIRKSIRKIGAFFRFSTKY